jgi:predicted metal-dependent peptidase
MLRAALGVATIPAGGLDMPGAREKSAEQIVVEMRRNGETPSRTQVWEGEVVTAGRVFGPSTSTGNRDPSGSGDVLGDRREREMFPTDSEDQAGRSREIGDLAARGLALGKAMGAMRGRGAEAGDTRQVVDALRGIYSTPWQMALQTWLEGVVPGERTFVRPSRRGADRHDVVLPGRRRHAWMLNVVLDTSGSMSEEIPRALGAIADFCDAAAVDDIRLVQCDTAVTSDDVLTPADLAAYQVSGYGGSDLTPAMLALADDARVTAAIVITDGDITFPAEPMPYAVLWVLPPHGQAGFQPPYGRVIAMQPGEGR